MKRVAIYLNADHKTVKNTLARKAFTVSMADTDRVTECDYLGIVSTNQAPGKVARAGFHVTKSARADAPLVDELPLALECRFVSFDEKSELLAGEIINVGTGERILNADDAIDLAKLCPITSDMANSVYLVLGEKVGNVFQDGKRLE